MLCWDSCTEERDRGCEERQTGGGGSSSQRRCWSGCALFVLRAPCQRPLRLGGLTNGNNNPKRKLRRWHFSLSFFALMFYTSCIYKELNTLRGILMKSTFWVKIQQKMCGYALVLTETEYNSPRALLRDLYSISTSKNQATSNYTPEASRPVALSSNKYLPEGQTESIN